MPENDATQSQTVNPVTTFVARHARNIRRGAAGTFCTAAGVPALTVTLTNGVGAAAVVITALCATIAGGCCGWLFGSVVTDYSERKVKNINSQAINQNEHGNANNLQPDTQLHLGSPTTQVGIGTNELVLEVESDKVDAPYKNEHGNANNLQPDTQLHLGASGPNEEILEVGNDEVAAPPPSPVAATKAGQQKVPNSWVGRQMRRPVTNRVDPDINISAPRVNEERKTHEEEILDVYNKLNKLRRV